MVADDGSDDDVEGGSGSGFEQLAGSGFDPGDFFTSGDVTTDKPAAAGDSDDSDDNEESETRSRGVSERRVVCSGCIWLTVGLQSCIIVVRWLFYQFH